VLSPATAHDGGQEEFRHRDGDVRCGRLAVVRHALVGNGKIFEVVALGLVARLLLLV
jgi:hypothetical protein